MSLEPHIQFIDQDTKDILLSRVLNPSQLKFFNSKAKYVLLNGGMGSGKTEPLIIKMILDALNYPDNYILAGRKTYQEIHDSLLKDFETICPPSFIVKRIMSPHPSFKLRCPGSDKTSEIIFRNLDKLAETEIKGMNLGEIFIDQIEGIPEASFQGLTMRLRRKGCPLRGFATANPELNWLYQRIKKEKDPLWEVIESPSTENYHNLPEDTVKTYEQYKESDPSYYRQYVLGVWDESLMSENTVFAREHIDKMNNTIENPKRTWEGLKIYREFQEGHKYQMGVDCAEGGGGDNASITISDLTDLEVAAHWYGQSPIDAVAERCVDYAKIYSKSRYGGESCLIVPEMNAMGLALLNKLKESGWDRIYQREEYDNKTGKKTMKLGWRTTTQTKPLLITNFKHLVRNFDVRVHAKETVNELRAFIWTDDSKKKGAGALEGFHDDNVISLLLSFWEKTRRDPSAVIIRNEKKKFPVNTIPSVNIVNGKVFLAQKQKKELNLSL